MIQPKYIFNTKTPDHPSRLFLLSPDALSDRQELQIPVTFEDIGGTATEHVDVRVEPVGDTPIDGLSLEEGSVPKATWKDPYGEGDK